MSSSFHLESHPIDVAPKNDIQEEFLHNFEESVVNVDLRRVCFRRPDLFDPLILSIENEVLQVLQHYNELVFVESMGQAFPLALPLIV